MKVRHGITLVILALAIACLFVGCGFLDTGTTIDSRIDQFVTSVNEDTTGTYKHFSNSAIANAVKDTNFWETWFPAADGPYTYVITSKTDATDVRVTITGETSSLANDYSFDMTDTGDYVEDWFISDISIYSIIDTTWTSIFGTT
jgi:hypothetical protein